MQFWASTCRLFDLSEIRGSWVRGARWARSIRATPHRRQTASRRHFSSAFVQSLSTRDRSEMLESLFDLATAAMAGPNRRFHCASQGFGCVE